MSYRGKKKIKGRFAYVEYHVIESFARLKVSHAAIVAYLLLKKSYWPEKHGERILCTFPEATKFMSSRTFVRALKELQEKGFVERVESGGMRSGRPGRCATIYELRHAHMKKGDR